jgi:hypothetical protein
MKGVYLFELLVCTGRKVDLIYQSEHGRKSMKLNQKPRSRNGGEIGNVTDPFQILKKKNVF